MKFRKTKTKLWIGIFLGVIFLALALRKVDLAQMGQAFRGLDYWYLWVAIPVIFISHFLRVLRWRYLIDPIKRLEITSLFSPLMIGYMVNTFTPAHLGDILRAYVLSKKKPISAGSAFATIVMERIIDMFNLLILLVLTMLVYPFPYWVKKSGYIMFAGTGVIFIFLLILKMNTPYALKFIKILLSPFPMYLQDKAENFLLKFISGIMPLKRRSDYFVISVLSIIMWGCYALVFYLTLQAFHFITSYNLPWSTGLILLVITTISIVIPSSPGYVGTYHYLCQLTLALFSVPPSYGFSFGAVVHGLNFIPVLIVGLFFAYYEGFTFSKMAVTDKASVISYGRAKEV